MKEVTISFDTAILAKSKGFNKTVYYEHTKEKLWYSIDGKKVLWSTFDSDEEDYVERHLDILIPAPTQSLLQKWLREVKITDVIIYDIYVYNGTRSMWNRNYKARVADDDLTNPNEVIHDTSDPNFFNTYEEALEFGLNKALNELTNV